MARDDDVINVAGHRLSTSALEEAVLEHPDVIDCAVVGIPDKLKGQVPLALFILRQGLEFQHAYVHSHCPWDGAASSLWKKFSVVRRCTTCW